MVKSVFPGLDYGGVVGGKDWSWCVRERLAGRMRSVGFIHSGTENRRAFGFTRKNTDGKV